MSSIGVLGTLQINSRLLDLLLTYPQSSIGTALIDTLDEMVHDSRIEPQLAMKVLTSFDKVVAETLPERVKARLNFKVNQIFGFAYLRVDNIRRIRDT